MDPPDSETERHLKMKKETPNYTPDQEKLILDAIAANGGKGNKSVAEQLAADPRMNGENGPRNARSIIAKMTRMDVPYERVEPKTKDGKPVTKKADLVASIAKSAGVAVEKLSGLENSPKLALETLAAAFG